MIGVAKDVDDYLAYKYRVGDLVGRPLKKLEVELTLDRYLEGGPPRIVQRRLSGRL